MWRGCGERLTFTWRVVSGVVGQNGRIFGGPERHLGIVGASTLKSGGPMGEVDLERSLEWWVVVPGARRSASCQGAVRRWYMWWCRVYSPPFRAYTFTGS